MKKVVLVGLISVLGFGLVACTGDQITNSLEDTVDLLIATEPIIATAVGVNPATQSLISNYLGAASSCVTAAVGVLSNDAGLSVAEVGVVIVSACSSVVAPSLPSGTPSTIVAALNSIANALKIFLGNIQTMQASLVSEPEFSNSFFGSSKPASLRKLDQRKLARIRAKLAKLPKK
jgi:hypothetical protein